MAKQALTLEALDRLEGGVISRAFEHEMGRIVADIKDRPGEERVRTLTLKVEVAPLADDRGIAIHSAVAFDVSCKLPSKKSTEYRMAISGNKDELLFNPLTPEDPEQTHMADLKKPA